MKVIFAGPTLYGADITTSPHYELRPPARQGDFYKAVQDGATVIGLIDGVYEYVPAIWHKEILYGLSKGVHTFGAASMGALRAAECASFGMVGIGEIYEAYATGRLEDDSDVALSHAPAEVGFLPLSVPLVNATATISKCLELSRISPEEHNCLLTAAKRMFFKTRTYKELVRSSISNQARAADILEELRENSINQKLLDAQLLIETVIATPDERFAPQFDWTFAETNFWKATFQS